MTEGLREVSVLRMDNPNWLYLQSTLLRAPRHRVPFRRETLHPLHLINNVMFPWKLSAVTGIPQPYTHRFLTGTSASSPMAAGLPLIKAGFFPTWSQEAAALTCVTFKLLGILPGK